MRPALYLPIMILLIGLGWQAYEVEQSSFLYIISLYSLSFAAYLLILFNKEKYFFPVLLAAAVIGRAMMIPTFPILSDDIYRFYWDAWVYAQGYSPYALLPSEVIQTSSSPEMLTIYSNLNSPDYYSVYPPILQWIFRLSYWISPTLHGFTLAYKSFIFLTELLSLLFLYLSLKKLSGNIFNIFIYALNPLIILELCANAHPEAFMITGLNMLLYGIVHLPVLRVLGWAIGIGVKLQPLLLAPLMLSYALLKKRILWIIGSLVTAMVLLLPLLLNPAYLENFTESLRLYTQTFEFNGSLYKLLRWTGYQWKGYNMIASIGPVLSAIAFFIISAIGLYHFLNKKTNIDAVVRFMFLSWMIYLICSPIVHPWYIAPLILFSIFIGFRSGIVWSYLIVLSYISYNSPAVEEPVWLAFIEYLPVFIFLFLDVKNMSGKQTHR